MSKYFMGETRLSGLERMMMDPSRTPSIRTNTRKKRPRKTPLRSQSAKRNPCGRRLKEGGV